MVQSALSEDLMQMADGEEDLSCDSIASQTALAAAERTKSEGNALFGAGKHDEAAELYAKALNGLESLTLHNTVTTTASPAADSKLESSKVTLRSNLAACFLATEHYQEAASESEEALKLDPLHIKSRVRLAKALLSLDRVRDAAEAMAVAVALMMPKSRQLDAEMTHFYNELAERSANSSSFNLPPETSSIVSVASSQDLAMALMKRESVIVLRPGSYSNLQLSLSGPLALIGIGEVQIVSIFHPLLVSEGHVFASHLTLVALSMRSAACVLRDARLTLVDCEAHGLRDTGLLVEGDAVLERCSFSNLGKQAVEVRKGGSVVLRGCHIRNCHQGAIAYGGARRLEIINSEISHNIREGVAASGEIFNAATRAQKLPLTTHNAASIDAHRWAQEAKVQLEVVISSSVVKNNGYFGLSLDHGAQVSVMNSVLLENEPFACFVKGATNALVSGSHIVCRKGQEGVHVGINYGANVTVSGNTFIVGDSRAAIVEELSASSAGAGSKLLLRNRMGAWSRPVAAHDNKIFVAERSPESGDNSVLPSVPSLDLLAATEVAEHEGSIKSKREGARSSSSSRNLSALAGTCRQMCRGFTKGPEYYAVGNTFGYDLSLGQILSAEAGSNVNILLGACGDIRNLLKTVHCMRQRGLDSQNFKVHVVLNDMNMSIVARDIVLLSLISRGALAVDVVALWANHAITVAQRALLESVLDELRSSLPEWLTLPADAESQTSAELAEIFSAWRECSMPLQGLLALHEQSVTLNTSIFESAVKLAEDAVGHNHFNKQIRAHIQSGNVCRIANSMTSANPLMLEAPTLQYLLYWSSSIFRAIQIDAVAERKSSRPEKLDGVLIRTLTPQFDAVAEALKGGTLRIAAVPGDILDALIFGGCRRILSQLARSSTAEFFDFVDLSNVADYVSLPAVVQAALPLLKPVSHARVHAQSMQWRNLGLDDPSTFLRESVGMEVETYQELLGVSMRAETVGSLSHQVLHTQWAWDLRGSSQQTSWLTGATVLLEIMSAAKLHCAIDRVTQLRQRAARPRMQLITSGKLAGLDCSSPATLLHLLGLACPGLLMPLVRLLVGRHGSQRKRKWELLGHALIQTDPLKSQQSFCRVEFEAKAQFYKMLACAHMPLCVVVSSVRLVQGEEIPSATVLQFIEAFAYSCETDRVEFLLKRTHIENPKWKAYFVTLCVVADSTCLEAVGISVELRDLAIGSGPGPLPIWTACESQPPTTRPWLSRNATLIEMISKLPANPELAAWTTHAVHETSTLVVVELLLPRPFPGAEKATLVVSSSGDKMSITVMAVRAKKTKSEKKALARKPAAKDRATTSDHEADGAGFAFAKQHAIDLPAVVSSTGHITKLSRQLGLMVVRVPKLST